MLDTLKNLFNKNKNADDSDLYDPETASNPNFLTDPDKVCKLLKDIEEASPLCTIVIDGTVEKYNSSILDVQIAKKQIILDELLPKQGNEILVNKQKLKLSTIYNGIHLAFNLERIHSGSSSGIAYYKAPLPSRIYYPQRRSNPRIQLNSLNITFSGISDRTKLTLVGNIFDLSRGGIGITTSDNRARFQRGDSINNCQITLDNHTLNFDLAVRFIKTSNHNSRHVQIGGYFENLSPKSQKKLEHFVASLEREEIRKRKE